MRYFVQVSAVSKAFAFFDSCMNIKDKVPRINNPLATLIKKYLPWPIVDDNWNKTSVHLSRLIARVIRDFDSSPFFKVVVQSDLKNSTVNVINVSRAFYFKARPYWLYVITIKDIYILIVSRYNRHSIGDYFHIN